MHKYPVIFNIILYQLVWFGCVFFQDKFIVPGVLLIILHLLLCENKARELAVMAYCASMGLAMDATLTLVGLFQFESTAPFLPIPLWLILIWVGFAGTLMHGLRYFTSRPRLALAAAAVGAPLIYHSASRLGAVTFPVGPLVTGVVVSVCWLILMVMFLLFLRVVTGGVERVT